MSGFIIPQNICDVVPGISASSGAQPISSGAGALKGAYAQLFAATPFTSVIFLLSFQIGIGGNVALDIAFGASMSEIIKVPDLLILKPGAAGAYIFPVFFRIPSGTRLSARIADIAGGGPNALIIGVNIFG
jgi:hypothetical protein